MEHEHCSSILDDGQSSNIDTLNAIQNNPSGTVEDGNVGTSRKQSISLTTVAIIEMESPSSSEVYEETSASSVETNDNLLVNENEGNAGHFGRVIIVKNNNESNAKKRKADLATSVQVCGETELTVKKSSISLEKLDNQNIHGRPNAHESTRPSDYISTSSILDKQDNLCEEKKVNNALSEEISIVNMFDNGEALTSTSTTRDWQVQNSPSASDSNATSFSNEKFIYSQEESPSNCNMTSIISEAECCYDAGTSQSMNKPYDERSMTTVMVSTPKNSTRIPSTTAWNSENVTSPDGKNVSTFSSSEKIVDDLLDEQQTFPKHTSRKAYNSITMIFEQNSCSNVENMTTISSSDQKFTDGASEKEQKCPDCNAPGSFQQFRRIAARLKKGQRAKWIWKNRCNNCEKFFGETWVFNPENNKYSRISQDLSENGSNTYCQDSPERISIDKNIVLHTEDSPSSSEIMVVMNTVGSSKQKSANSREQRRKNTMRKTTIVRNQPSINQEEEYSDEEKTSIDSTSNIDSQNKKETEAQHQNVIRENSSKVIRGRGNKRTMMNIARESCEPPTKVVLQIPQEQSKSTSKEEAKTRAAEVTKQILENLQLHRVEKASMDETEEAILSNKAVLMRSMKVVGILKTTITRLTMENTQLKEALQSVKDTFDIYSTTNRTQASGLQALVDSLAKELKFFKNECISECRATNELYKKQQAEFEVKYGYRVIERDLVQERFDNLEEKFKGARLHMRQMADEIARLENEIHDYEKMKKSAAMGKYMKCQTCDANEMIITRMRAELSTIRNEKVEWHMKMQKLEKQLEVDRERLKVTEQELKKQSFLARSYEALDKQNRAKEIEAATKVKIAPAVTNTTKLSTPLPKTPKSHETPQTPRDDKYRKEKDQKKEDDMKIPALSDILDPEILAAAAKMSSQGPRIRLPQMNSTSSTVTSSVVVTPESLHNEHHCPNLLPHSHQSRQPTKYGQQDQPDFQDRNIHCSQQEPKSHSSQQGHHIHDDQLPQQAQKPHWGQPNYMDQQGQQNHKGQQPTHCQKDYQRQPSHLGQHNHHIQQPQYVQQGYRNEPKVEGKPKMFFRPQPTSYNQRSHGPLGPSTSRYNPEDDFGAAPWNRPNAGQAHHEPSSTEGRINFNAYFNRRN